MRFKMSERLPNRQKITRIGQALEKREPLYTVGENVNWCNHYEKQYGRSLKKLKTELPYNPAIPLLDIFKRKNIH